LLATLSGLNDLPSTLYSYDTAEPWGSFVGTTALGFVAAVPLTLILWGLWLVLGALRRRVGIPMLRAEPSRSSARDMLLAGLGLGGVVYALTRLGTLLPRGSMPRTPSTLLDSEVPLLAGLPDIPANALVAVALIGIPMLVVAGLARRWTVRALLATTIVALAVAVAWSFAPVGDVDAARMTLFIVAAVVAVVALVVWGAQSAWSWIVAALVYQALNGLRDAAYEPVWQARSAGAFAFLVAGALVVFIARRATVTTPSISS
jgi:hypothetical protein